MSAKSPSTFTRNASVAGHHHTHKNMKSTCRAVTRSPVDFREGRRASDGLVAQGILNTADHPLNSGVAFNSQRLHEACKAKGVLELHLLQKEAAQLNTQYQANVPIDEMNVRQLQHTQFHVTPAALKACDLNALIHCAVLKQQQNGSGSMGPEGLLNKVSDLSSFVGMLKSE
jgi:hypothetical protein